MNITTQAQELAQGRQLQHGGVFTLNSPSNCVVPNMVGQFSQHFKQSSNDAQFFIADIKRITTRIRLVMHDACVLSFQMIDYSLDTPSLARLEQNELYFWKRDQGVISND